MPRAFSSISAVCLALSLHTYALADAGGFSPKNQSTESPPTITPEPPLTPTITPEPEKPKSPFTAFTGKVTKNRVRLRIQPNLDGPILKELNRGDMMIVIGETDDFYAVKPPEGMKAYIFRTFVLDNVVEGTRVNVRLEPTLESPIIAQLNQGDRIQGTVSPLNSKWFEIAPPESTRFYVAKEFVENIGDPSTMAKIQKRYEEAEKLWLTAYSASQQEFQKPFDQMNAGPIFNDLNKIESMYSDFPEFSEKAKTLLGSLQDTYTRKKLAYLETQNQMLAQQEKLHQIELKAKTDALSIAAIVPQTQAPSSSAITSQADKTSATAASGQFQPTSKMAAWAPKEQEAYEAWAADKHNTTMVEFYHQENEEALTLQGIIESYQKNVQNRPGDYLLINKTTKMPMAYLYSTQVNLEDKIGQEVNLKVSKRPNNHFAFPAYYVLSLQ